MRLRGYQYLSSWKKIKIFSSCVSYILLYMYTCRVPEILAFQYQEFVSIVIIILSSVLELLHGFNQLFSGNVCINFVLYLTLLFVLVCLGPSFFVVILWTRKIFLFLHPCFACTSSQVYHWLLAILQGPQEMGNSAYVNILGKFIKNQGVQCYNMIIYNLIVP